MANDRSKVGTHRPSTVGAENHSSWFRKLLATIALCHICCYVIEIILRQVRFLFPDPYFNSISDLSIVFFFTWLGLGGLGVLLTCFYILSGRTVSILIVVWAIVASILIVRIALIAAPFLI